MKYYVQVIYEGDSNQGNYYKGSVDHFQGKYVPNIKEATPLTKTEIQAVFHNSWPAGDSDSKYSFNKVFKMVPIRPLELEIKKSKRAIEI
jgi:hypothetical protein